MTETKVSKVTLCCLCEEYDNICEHDLPYPGYRCNLCRFVHPLNREAQSCCMDLVSKSTLDESHFSKEKKGKKAEAEIPVGSLQGKRDK